MPPRKARTGRVNQLIQREITGRKVTTPSQARARKKAVAVRINRRQVETALRNNLRTISDDDTWKSLPRGTKIDFLQIIRNYLKILGLEPERLAPKLMALPFVGAKVGEIKRAREEVVRVYTF